MKIIRQESGETTEHFEKRVNKASGEADGCLQPAKVVIQTDKNGNLIAIVGQ